MTPPSPQTDPEARRRARRRQSPAAASAPTAPQAVEPEIMEAVRPDAYRLLGVERSASRLEVVRAFQRVLRSAPSEDARDAIRQAFERTGVKSIRTVCPYGHPTVLYDLAGEQHSVYCTRCYEQTSEHVSHPYLTGATCTGASFEPAMMDENKLPYEVEPEPLQKWTVSYRTPAVGVPDPTVEFTCDEQAHVNVAAGDRFSVLWLDKEPWLLLNHTCAVTFALDPYIRHRKAMAKAREDERIRRQQWSADFK